MSTAPNPKAASRMQSRLLGLWLSALGMALILVFWLPHLLTLKHFFFEDDFLLLHYYGGLPLYRLDAFFEPPGLFFYRPLSYWLVAASGGVSGGEFHPMGPNLLGATLWLAAAGLFWTLARSLLDSFGALLALVVFLASTALSSHLFFWTATLGAAAATCLTLGALALWLRELERLSPRFFVLAGVGLALAVAVLTRESVASWLALFVWALAGRWAPALRPWGAAVCRDRRLVVAGAACLLPAVAASCFVFWVGFGHPETANPLIERAYDPVSPVLWLPQMNEALGRSLAPLLVLGDWRGLPVGALFQTLAVRLPILPAALLSLALWRRSRTALFGVAWAVVALVPAAFTSIYASPRYLYGAALGLSLAVGALAAPGLACLGRGESGGKRLGRVVMIASVALYLVLCLEAKIRFFSGLEAEHEACRELALAVQAAAPPGRATLFVVEGVPGLRDLGLEELVRIVLQRENVSALTASGYEAFNAYGYYDATYPTQVLLRWTGERFEIEDGSRE